MRNLGLLLVLILSISACANKQRIIIDRKGVDMARYERDLAECQSYADEISLGEQAAKGGVAGAVIGGAIGAVVGNSRSAEKAAGAGAVSGTARGAARGENEKRQVLRRCLIGRGYKVLN